LKISTQEYLKSAIEIPGTRVWRDPSGKIYCGEIGVYNAQFLDLTAITAKVVMEEVLGLARPEYILRNICRVVGMPKLVGTYIVGTKYSADEKVPPLVEAELKKQTYVELNFALWKNVVHVALADEEQAIAVIDVMRTHSADAAGALAASENSQIKVIAEAATAIAGADWGDSTKNPYDDIGAVQEVVEAAGYPVDFMAANPRVWGDFFSNAFVKGSAVGVRLPTGRIFDVPGLPGVRGYSDFSLTNTICLVGSSRAPALVFAEGPTTSAKYRNEAAGFDAFIIRQWLEPKLAVSTAIRKLTGVHA